MVLLAIASTVLLVSLVAPRTFLRFQAGLVAGAVRLGNAVLWGCLALIGALLVLPAWLLNRAIGARALDDGWNGSTTAWRTRTAGRRTDGRPQDPWRMAAVELPVGPGTRRARRRRSAVGVVAMVAVIAGALSWLGAAPWSPDDAPTVASPPIPEGDLELDPMGESAAAPSTDQSTTTTTATEAPTTTSPVLEGAEDLTVVGLPVTEYAHEDEPWFPDHVRETDAMGVSSAWDPALGVRYGDYAGSTINLVDGHRRTYQPEGEDLTVWYFGGSTMFGLGQRDDHTIPSVIARLAERDGIELRSVNFGAMSTVNWSETQAFAEALTVEEPPDLVVFYDGANEVGTAFSRVELGQTDPDRSVRSLVTDAERQLLQRPAPDLEVDEQRALVRKLAAAQYRRGVELGKVLGSAYGVEVLHFWQPSLDSKLIGPEDREAVRRVGLDREVGERGDLPARTLAEADVDVIDLNRALDDTDRPVFWDWAHTNEYGASLVAAAIYEDMRTPIEELLADQ